jgi:hypothetical protein
MILILSELECKVIKVFDSSPLGKESVPVFFILPRLGNKVRQGFQILPLGNKLSVPLPYNELAITQGPKIHQKKELKIQQEKDPDRM